MIEYDSDAKELERMMATVGGYSNPGEGDGVKREAPPNVMGQPISREPTTKIEILKVAMLPMDTSNVEVLREKPVLGVARVS